MSFSGIRPSSPDRGTDAFAKSLRQYPVPQGENTSPDLIQRLLAYTQAKNFSKSSYHTKGIRNMRIRNMNRQAEFKGRTQNTAKGVQTYTRASRKSKERDVDVNMRREDDPWFGSRIPQNPSDSKDDYDHGIYDYLGTGAPEAASRRTRASEVRYLDDITRRVKNTFLQIYDDRCDTCPNIEERYNRHRSDHHREMLGVQSSFRDQNIQAQGAGQAPCQPDSDVCTETNQPAKTCCYCKQRIPCNCKTRKSIQTQKPTHAPHINDDCFCKKIEQEVFAWLDAIPVSANDKPEHRVKRVTLAKSLVNKLNSVKRDQYFEENAQNEILECLNSMPMWSPVKRSDEQIFKSQIVDNLLCKLREVPNDNNNNDIALIVNNISFVFSNSSSKIFDDSNLKKSLENSLKKLVKGTSPILKSKVLDILEEYPIKIKDDKYTYLNDLANTLTEKLQSISLDSSNSDSTPERFNKSLAGIREILKNEVNSVLNNSRIQPQFKDEIKSPICDILADQIMRSDSSRIVDDQIMTILKNTLLSDEESEKIMEELINKARGLSLKYKSTTPSFNENQNKNLMDLANRNIVKFTQQLQGDSNTASMKNWESAALKLAEQVVNIKKSTESSFDEKNRLRNEVMKYFQKMNINSDSDEQANNLVNILQHLSFKTSTPRSSRNELSFATEQNSEYPNLSSIIQDNSFVSPYQMNSSTNNENSYRLQLMEKIGNWVHSLPIYLDSEETNSFKKAVAKDLTDEIISRQKYLQLNYTLKPSEQEEQEYLKYQVYRWLNKSPHISQILTSITKTNDLLKQINELPVPQLVNLEKNNNMTQPEEESKYMSIANDILKWIEAVPKDLYVSTDRYYHRRLITNLIECIEQLKYSGNSAETDLDDLLFRWLQKMFDINKQSAQSMISELKAIILNQQSIRLDKGKTSMQEDDTYMRIKNKNVPPRIQSSIEPVLKHIINDWTRHLPFQTGQSCENIQKDIEDFIRKIKETVEISTLNNLTKVKADLEQQINGFLKTLPILKYQSNHNHVPNLISKILEVVNKTLNQDSTKPFTRPSGIENFYDGIESWCNKLPISRGTTINEQENSEMLKQNVASKIMNKIAKLNMKPEIFNDDTLYIDLIRDEIDDVLNDLPQNDELQNKRDILKQMLIDKVNIAKRHTEYDLAGYAYKQKLHQAISSTLPSVQNLSIEEQVPFEILKERLADAFINLSYCAHNDYLKSKYKKQISDEISRYCNDYLKRYPASPIDPVILNQDLHTALQSVPAPRDETIKSQIEQLRIKNIINNWLKALPVNDESPVELLQKTKIISILAKDLHELTKVQVDNDHDDRHKIMKQNILKWMKKLSIPPIAEHHMDEFSEKLIDDLKLSEDNFETNTNPTITSAKISPTDSWTQHSPINKDSRSKYVPPASSLSQKERHYLEKIKRRSRPSLHPNDQKDLPQHPYIDGGETNDPFDSTKQKPIWPNVIVNEYNWNNSETSISYNDEHERRQQKSVREESYHSISSPCTIIQDQSEQVWGQPVNGLKSQYNSKVTETTKQQHFDATPPHKTHYQTTPKMTSKSIQSQSSPNKISRPYTSRESQTYSKESELRKLQNLSNSLTSNNNYEDPSSCQTSQQAITNTDLYNSQMPPRASYEPLRTPGPKRKTRESQTNSTVPAMSNTSPPPDTISIERHDNGANIQPENQALKTRLPSTDDVGIKMKNIVIQCPRSNRCKNSSDEDSDWTMRFPDHTDLWDSSGQYKRRSCRICIPSENHKQIKDKLSERAKCRCKDRVLGKCVNKPSGETNQKLYQNSQHCPKCCVRYCPHPSNLYFE